MWFFRLFPSTFPELEITTAVFHRVLRSSSRSRIGEMMTMLCFLANWRKSHSVSVRLSSTLSQLESHLLAETCGDSFFSRLGKLRPRFFLTGAESKGHGCREQKRPFHRLSTLIFWFKLLKKRLLVPLSKRSIFTILLILKTKRKFTEALTIFESSFWVTILVLLLMNEGRTHSMPPENKRCLRHTWQPPRWFHQRGCAWHWSEEDW